MRPEASRNRYPRPWRAPAPASLVALPPTPTRSERTPLSRASAIELPRAEGGRDPGIPLGRGEQRESGCPRHLHDGTARPSSPTAPPAAAERVVGPGAVPLARQRIHQRVRGPGSPVREGEDRHLGIGPAGAHAGLDGPGGLAGGQASLELQRGGEDADGHGRRGAATGRGGGGGGDCNRAAGDRVLHAARHRAPDVATATRAAARAAGVALAESGLRVWQPGPRPADRVAPAGGTATAEPSMPYRARAIAPAALLPAHAVSPRATRVAARRLTSPTPRSRR